MIGDPPWSLMSPQTTIKKIRNAPLRSTIGNAAVQTANEYEYRFAEYEDEDDEIRCDARSLHYRLKERTWATPASVFPGDLLFQTHCELGALARNPLLAFPRCCPGIFALTAKAPRTQREIAMQATRNA
jgi:hypothetical protein